MKKNFTLIELLVVIAIIAILAAILLPALQESHFFAFPPATRSFEHKILVQILYNSRFNT